METPTEINPEDLPLAKELAGVLTLEIRRFLLEKNKDNTISNKTLSIVSHELKTPVTSLRTILQVLKSRLEADPKKFDFADNAEYVDFSLREIDRLTVLVNDLLDFNRLNRGALQFNFINMDVQPTVEGAVNRTASLCKTHTITYTRAPSPCIVSLDAPRFEQAMDNFLTNAIKYSPKGSTIAVATKMDEGGAVTITIHNEGVSIPNDEQANLFEPYYRTPTAEASGIGGLGIGLFISKQIIETHKGTVTLVSAPEQGTTITIMLPRADIADGGMTHRKNVALPMAHPPQHSRHHSQN